MGHREPMTFREGPPPILLWLLLGLLSWLLLLGLVLAALAAGGLL